MKANVSTLDFLKTSFGNILEWYDFALYGIFAELISRAFFPNSNHFISLLLTFLTFSISFIARPLGSFIFGAIGDKVGPRYSVNLSVWAMALPTIIIGLVPTYNTIGLFAPFLLMFLRFIQGISVGGQFSGLIVIASENSNNRSYLVSLILSISLLGSLLATVIGLLSSTIFTNFSVDLVWRIPFLLSGVLFFIYIKLKPNFEKAEPNSSFKISHIFKRQPSEVLYMTLLSAIMACIYYILFTYFLTYMQIHLTLSRHSSLVIMNIVLILSLFSYPIFGKFADKTTDRIKFAKKFIALYAFGVILLSLDATPIWIVGCLSILVIAYAAIASSLTSLFAEVFDREYRMTACSICYSGGAILGGFSPLASEILASKAQGSFYMFLLVLGFMLYLIQDKIASLRGYQKVI